MLISNSASTTASFLQISANLARSQAVTAADPIVKNATAYYLANIGKVASVKDFVNDYKLFSYAMTAFGLGSMAYAKGLMTKVLEGGVTKSNSLANTMADPRFKAFAAVFDFAGKGAAVTGSAAATTGIASQYVEQTLETNLGQQNQGVQLALYFQRKASSVTRGYGILADPALLQVTRTLFGISPYSGEADIDIQAAQINKVLHVADLQDPKKVLQLTERFTAMWDLQGSNASTGATTTPTIGGQANPIGLSTNLLLSIAQLPRGGT